MITAAFCFYWAALRSHNMASFLWPPVWTEKKKRLNNGAKQTWLCNWKGLLKKIKKSIHERWYLYLNQIATKPPRGILQNVLFLFCFCFILTCNFWWCYVFTYHSKHYYNIDCIHQKKKQVWYYYNSYFPLSPWWPLQRQVQATVIVN